MLCKFQDFKTFILYSKKIKLENSFILCLKIPKIKDNRELTGKSTPSRSESFVESTLCD